MDSAALAAYGLVAATLVASPGPDSLLIIRNTLGGGRAAGAMTLAGVQLGIAGHALLAVAGLSSLLYASPAAFRALALAGALYLAALGIATIRHGIAPPPRARARPRRAFVQGMLCNLLNPKVIVLFVALMPSFVDLARGDYTRQIIALAAILLAINIPFQFALVLAAARAHALLARGALAIRCGLGGLLIFFALLLFAQHVLDYIR